MKYILTLIVLAAFCGCTTATVVSSNTPPIVLKDTYIRKSRGVNTIHLPAGLYEPDFQTDAGVYYKAHRKVVVDSLGINQVFSGGLFIPFESQIDQRQAAWFDYRESGGIFQMANSSKDLYRFDPPVSFEEFRDTVK